MKMFKKIFTVGFLFLANISSIFSVEVDRKVNQKDVGKIFVTINNQSETDLVGRVTRCHMDKNEAITTANFKLEKNTESKLILSSLFRKNWHNEKVLLPPTIQTDFFIEFFDKNDEDLETSLLDFVCDVQLKMRTFNEKTEKVLEKFVLKDFRNNEKSKIVNEYYENDLSYEQVDLYFVTIILNGKDLQDSNMKIEQQILKIGDNLP